MGSVLGQRNNLQAAPNVKNQGSKFLFSIVANANNYSLFIYNSFREQFQKNHQTSVTTSFLANKFDIKKCFCCFDVKFLFWNSIQLKTSLSPLISILHSRS